MIKSFDEYLKEGVIKKQTPDISRANFLINESEKSYFSLFEIIDKIGIKNEHANNIVKLSYDVIMELIRSKMLQDGFSSSGLGAHEAEVSYMRNIGFNENDIIFMDQLRFFRNRITYYGKILDKEYSNQVIIFLKRIYPKLKNLIKIK